MGTLASLLVDLIMDAEKFNQGLDEAESAAGSSTQKIGDSLKGIGENVTEAGAIASVAITAPVMLFGTEAVKAAQDGELAMRQVQAVFGASADAVQKFGETAPEALGMADDAALLASGTFGNMFTMMGIGQPKAADMSMNLVKLAADLASFNGMDPSEVLDKLQSGMMGATRGLKSMGIAISESDIKTEAMKEGIWDGKGAIDEQVKSMAIYQIIMDKTSKMQGDFAKNQGSLASQTKIAGAEIDRLKGEFGKELLPIVIDLMKAIIPFLQMITNLPKPVKDVILVVLGLAAAMGPVLLVVGQIVGSIGSLVTVIGGAGGLTAIFSGLVPAIVAIGGFITALGLPVIALIAAIGLLIFVLVTFGKQAWGTVTMIAEIARAIGGGLITGIWNGIQSGWNWLLDRVRDLAKAIYEAAKSVLGINSPSTLFADIGKNISMGLGVGITQYQEMPITATTGMASSLVPAMGSSVGGGSNRVVNITVNLTGQPFSFADERTIAQKLSPVLQVELRRLGVI